MDYQNIFESVNGRKEYQFPAAKIAHYEIGGAIDLLFYPETKLDCAKLIHLCKSNKIPYFLFGKGSNLLISDEGYRGVFISLDDCSLELELSEKKSYIGAGVILWDLIQETLKHGFGDMSNMSWIPGTVGGALFMNAGAFGTEIEEFVESVDVITQGGKIKTLSHKECAFQYRKSIHLQDKIILGATMLFSSSDKEKMKANSDDIISRRKSRQPLDYPSCGSVFKRPPGNYAGTLIEKSGLKGFRIGGAELSEKHANFILNKNQAKAQDIYDIIKHVQETVKKKHDIQLEREVKLIGFKNVKI